MLFGLINPKYNLKAVLLSVVKMITWWAIVLSGGNHKNLHSTMGVLIRKKIGVHPQRTEPVVRPRPDGPTAAIVRQMKTQPSQELGEGAEPSRARGNGAERGCCMESSDWSVCSLGVWGAQRVRCAWGALQFFPTNHGLGFLHIHLSNVRGGDQIQVLV